jgi:8-oxo-dGTP diphosphatase
MAHRRLFQAWISPGWIATGIRPAQAAKKGVGVAQVKGTIVSGFVFLNEGEAILLVKQKYGREYWSLPGGVMEQGESIEQAVIREVKEETGLDICLSRLIGVYSKPDECGLALTFEGIVVGGALQASSEISEAAYFTTDSLPQHVRPHFHQRMRDFLDRQPCAVVRTQ